MKTTTTTTTKESEPYILHDEEMGLYIVMINKNGKAIRISHFLTNEEAEAFLS
jgi:hypothetical protein